MPAVPVRRAVGRGYEPRGEGGRLDQKERAGTAVIALFGYAWFMQTKKGFADVM